MPTKKTMSGRDKVRWLGIGAGALSLGIGAFHSVPLTVWGKPVTDNLFLALGAAIMLLTFGVVQLVKAWRGSKTEQ